MTDLARRLRDLAPRQQSIEDSRTLERAAERLVKLESIIRTTRAYLRHVTEKVGSDESDRNVAFENSLKSSSSSPQNTYIEGKSGDNDDL